MEGYIHSIETFGTVDGPGIRYVVFLAGCRLCCSFCHNPDTWKMDGECRSVDEILADYERYRAFYDNSSGGITLSGGEPLLQPEFTATLSAACQAKKIHTIIDTAGYCAAESVKMILPHIDAALFCIKAARPQVYGQLTGGRLEVALANLQLLAGSVPVTLRYVVIPGINDAPEDIAALAQLAAGLPVSVELLAYHCLGVKKWEALGRPYALAGVRPATTKDLILVCRQLRRAGIRVLYLDE